MATKLFGPHRDLLGDEAQEWAVWVLGPDDVFPKDSLADALQLAVDLNVTYAALWLNTDSPEYTPVMYAVVLHWGYAWNVGDAHKNQRDCGRPDCGPCGFKRAFPEVAG